MHHRLGELLRAARRRELVVEARQPQRVVDGRGELSRDLAMLESAPHHDLDLVVPRLAHLVGRVGR